MVPNCATSTKYGAENGTLINFPYVDCNDPDNCEQGFIATAYHIGAIKTIIDAKDSNDIDYLEKVLIRFNWHHEYGTPWHLENIDCSASYENFLKWRSAINFDEVIDYCGVSVFAVQTFFPYDLVLLKMLQKPFFKEHHLGWTTQHHFDVLYSDHSTHGDGDFPAKYNELFKIIGRRTVKPTVVLENYNVYFQTYDPEQSESDVVRYHYTDATLGDVFPADSIAPLYLSGHSACQQTYYDYIDTNQRLGLGIMTGGRKNMYLSGPTYHALFNEINNYKFYDTCYYHIASTKRFNTFYFDNPNIRPLLDTIIVPHTYTDGGTSYFIDTVMWYPSSENRHKCPSTQGYDPGTEEYAPCTFDFRTAVTVDSLCVTIDGIYSFDFPNNMMPKGYRIYYHYGDQKTIEFEEFHDNINISFPIEFCVDECYLMYMMALGIDTVKIKIDFYDQHGRVLNNSGCDTLEIIIPYTFSLCEKFNLSVTKIDSVGACCTYKVEINMGACVTNNPLLHMLVQEMTFSSILEQLPIPITELDDLAIDYENGKITFIYEICEAMGDTALTFKIAYNKGNLTCESAPVHFPSCCYCPSQEVLQSWVEMTIEPGASPCGENYCKVSANLNIPTDAQNCFTHYSINHFFKHSIAGVTEVPRYDGSFGCIFKGEYRQDTFKFYKGVTDTEPCVVIKDLYCPIVEFLTPCTPDCEEVPWVAKDSVNFELPDCPQCSVKVYYVHRENTCYVPLKQELQILSFSTFSDPSDTTACINCSMTSNEVHNLALLKIIYENKMGFKPAEPSTEGACDTTWRVILAACWVEYQGAFGERAHQKCDSVECCSIGLKVCRFKDEPNPEYITTETIGGIEGSENCINFTQSVINWASFGVPILYPDGSMSSYYRFIELECEDKCSWLYGLNNEGFYGRQKVDFNFESKNYYGTDEIIMKIAVLENEIALEIDSEIASDDLVISVSSLLGIELISKKFKLSKGINFYQLNSSKLNTGLYILNLRLNGFNLKSEKLIIIK